MRVNLPITDREVVMQPGTILVTKTDLKGIITYANDAFVEISGFTREELIGKSHNIVRHPDMPEVAFQDLWTTVKQGRPWTAAVKNRTKNGDYYWVEANVTPMFEGRKVIGYLSARYAPSREFIKQSAEWYQKLNASGAKTMRPTGMVAKLKSLFELPLTFKFSVLAVAYLLPLIYFMTTLYQNGNYSALAIVGACALTAVALNYSLFHLINATLEKGTGICYRLANKSFSNKIDLNREDKIGDFWRGLYSMQVQLHADLAFAHEEGANAQRIKQALDNVASSVMVADNNLNIIYLNNTVKKLFQNAESDIQKQLPNFNAAKLLGSNIDIFHKNPAHQRQLLLNLSSTLSSSLQIGGRYLDIVANPVITESGVKIGVVVEWVDRSNEIKIENEIAVLVDAVKSGDLSSRIALDGKSGFYAKLSQGINEMSDVIDHGFVDVLQVMTGMAQGDLTQYVDNDYAGIYAECRDHINETTAKLRDVFSEIRDAAEFINNSSHEIASGNNNLSQRAEEQASSLEQTASSMEELTSTVKNNSDNAQRANIVASEARNLAEKGGDVVNSAVAAMQEINESSNKIAEIIGVIDEIAFQTNLLALNASVEAARAGEQGRGFSVVATEVRNLAQRSATAAHQSKELIQASVLKVRSGTQFVNETGKSLNAIVDSIKQVGDIVAEIASASAQQSAGIEQVNMAVAQMDEITQQNAALAEQASAASISMSEQAERMTALLDFFKVEVDSKPLKNNTELKTNSQSKHQKATLQTSKISKSTHAVDTETDADANWDEF